MTPQDDRPFPPELAYDLPGGVFRPGASDPVPAIWLAGEVSAGMVSALRQGINKLREREDRVLLVYVTTSGGDPAMGRALYQTLRQLRAVAGYEVCVIGMGTVLSAGWYPFLAVPRERRFMLEETRIGIHLSQVSLSLNFHGNARMRVELLRERLGEAEAVLRSNELMVGELAAACSVTREEMWELASRYYEPTLAEAVEMGLIGEVVGI